MQEFGQTADRQHRVAQLQIFEPCTHSICVRRRRADRLDHECCGKAKRCRGLNDERRGDGSVSGISGEAAALSGL